MDIVKNILDQLIRRKSFTYLIRLEGPKCTPGGSGVPVALVERRGGELVASAGCCAGLRRFAAGAVCCWCGGKRLSCRGENHSKREVPLDRKVITQKVHCTN